MERYTEPQHRLPEKYYQRRRVAAAVVVLVAVILVIWALVAWGNSRSDTESAEAAATSETTSVTTEASTTTETETSTQEAPPAPSETEDPVPESPYAVDEGVPVDEERTTCELRDLVITATSDQPRYPADVQPTFYMTVANPTAEDCEINLDEATLRFEVYDLATNERIWADTDCYEPVETGMQRFTSGQERYFEAVWSRTASAPGQCQNRPEVPAGSYFLHAVIGDNPSPAHTFNLS